MPFLKSVSAMMPAEGYPFDIPAVQDLSKGLKLHPKVTFFVGENGAGKSTVLEGIADKWGFSEESGNRTKQPNLHTYYTELAPALTISKAPGMRPMDGFFLRAESLFNFATEMDELERDPYTANGYFSYGGKSLHEQSHGESFFSIFLNRLDGHGLYLLDEPEAALSPTRQMAFLVRLHDLVRESGQFIIATHSPIILAYPEATIYEFSEDGLREVSYRETQPFQVTSRFLDDPDGMIGRLLDD